MFLSLYDLYYWTSANYPSFFTRSPRCLWYRW